MLRIPATLMEANKMLTVLAFVVGLVVMYFGKAKVDAAAAAVVGTVKDLVK